MALNEDLIKLREETGAGVMDCRAALNESGGDYKKAIEIIREKGLLKAEKREGRQTGAGWIDSYIHNERVGVLVELRTETDFVAKSEPFKKLTHELALQLAASEASSEEDFLSQPYIKDESKNVKDLISELVTKVGENVKLGKFYRVEI
ncbi:MAG: translation elongation factor Ts [Candidatus Pacebacteria bacterium]|nr:translation elongation factor Ts [Candidatus Paceibacterota bacterium]